MIRFRGLFLLHHSTSCIQGTGCKRVRDIMVLDSEYSGEPCSADRLNGCKNTPQDPALRFRRVERIAGDHISSAFGSCEMLWNFASFHRLTLISRRGRHALPGSIC